MPKAIDIEELASSAVAFDLSATLLEVRFSEAAQKSLLSGGKTFFTPTLVPSAVISALAIELYFKCLFQHEIGQYNRGHHLNEMFRELTNNPKTSGHAKLVRDRHEHITKLWDSEIPPQQKIELDKLMSGQPFNDNLDSVLRRGDQVFEKWRYFFEHNPKDRDLPDLVVLRLSTRHVFAKAKAPWDALVRRYDLDPNSTMW